MFSILPDFKYFAIGGIAEQVIWNYVEITSLRDRIVEICERVILSKSCMPGTEYLYRDNGMPR